MTVAEYPAGTLVRARGRDWLVLPGAPDGLLLARPLGGREDETTVLLPEFDAPAPAVFDPPTVDDRGDATRARLLRDALRLSFRATGGPFRSFGNLSVAPRNYQLVPLMMSAGQDTTRLLIADGVGVGKTIEAGLIAAELRSRQARRGGWRCCAHRNWRRSGAPSYAPSSASTLSSCCPRRSTG